MPGTKTFASADVLTAADVNAYLRGGLVMAYATKTANQTFTTIADVTGLSVTFTAIAGRLYKVSVVGLLKSSVANDICQLVIADGTGTTLAVSQQVCPNTTYSVPATTFYLATPSAGSVTYKARVVRVAGTGTGTLEAAATYPAYIIAEDVGVA